MSRREKVLRYEWEKALRESRIKPLPWFEFLAEYNEYIPDGFRLIDALVEFEGFGKNTPHNAFTKVFTIREGVSELTAKCIYVSYWVDKS